MSNDSPQVMRDNPQGTPLTTVKNYNPEVKAKAYELYLTTDLTPRDMAIELAVPETVILAWANEGGWLSRKQKLEMEYFLRADNTYRRFMADRRPDVAKRHLEISEKLENAIGAMIDLALKDPDNTSPADLKRFAEALSSVTGVSARAVGIGTADGGMAKTMALSQGEGGQATKQPVFILNLKPSVPSEKEIKVTEEDGRKVIDIHE